jgi:hypothetical protein
LQILLTLHAPRRQMRQALTLGIEMPLGLLSVADDVIE